MNPKLKMVLKVLWISLLSTLLKVLAQTLRAEGFRDFNTIKMAFVEVPFEYLSINFFIFLILSILFILINEQIPAFKLFKGIIYGILITVIWTVLTFQPMMFSNLTKYLIDIVVFSIPMLIYGVFLGYLSTDKVNTFKARKKHFVYLFISLGWLLMHVVYIIFVPPEKGQIFTYIIWMVVASLVLGMIFGFFYEINLKTKYNPLFINAIVVIVVFASFYAYRFSIENKFNLELFIRVLLDIVSVYLSMQLIEMFMARQKKIE